MATFLKPVQPRLGDVLLRSGQIDQATLSAALRAQSRSHVRLGQVLLHRGLLTPRTLTDALAQQCALPHRGLHPIGEAASDLSVLPLEMILRHRGLLLGKNGMDIRVGVTDPQHIPALQLALSERNPKFELLESTTFERRLEHLFGSELATRAENRCPKALSCRNWASDGQLSTVIILCLCVALLVLSYPQTMASGILGWIILLNSATTFLRLTAIIQRLRPPRDQRFERAQLTRLSGSGTLPSVSILLPCLDEGPYLQHLIDAIDAMDYPREAIEVLFLVEEHDLTTRDTLQMLSPLPSNFRPLFIPAGGIKTKPRAMNYALDFCTGDVIGIYDAEDRPAPDQLRKMAAAFAAAPSDVACVQAALDFYNTKQNWLTRCFFLEYATWFRVILHGLQYLKLPLPLGGTSLFIKRNVLEEIGAWDAHNVTEDADLGIRLARFGYRSLLIDSTTFEEANPAWRSWIKQRSRWLKGYIVTWYTHIRKPRRVIQDIGWRGFMALHVLFLGGVTAYLAIPIFWVISALSFSGLSPIWWDGLPAALKLGFWISLPAGQIVMLSAVCLALHKTKQYGLWPWVLSLPFYWPLGAIASYLALFEIFVKPFHWHKTRHGLAVE